MAGSPFENTGLATASSYPSGVGREGFEPPKAEPAILQTAPFGHLGTCPYQLLLATGDQLLSIKELIAS